MTAHPGRPLGVVIWAAAVVGVVLFWGGITVAVLACLGAL